MMRKSTQEKEHHYFDLFSRVYHLPEGQVRYGDKPDIIIEGKRRVGIEVTNFYLQNGASSESEQNQIILREQVLQKAQELYIAQQGKMIELTFTFNPNEPIHKKSKDSLTKQIVELVKSVDSNQTGELLRDKHKDIPEIFSVFLNSKTYSDPKWKPSQVYSIPEMSVNDLAVIVKNKEVKSKKYSSCDAYWLLIVIDFINPAQDQEILNGDIKIHSDVFEKIIIYKTTFNYVLEVLN